MTVASTTITTTTATADDDNNNDYYHYSWRDTESRELAVFRRTVPGAASATFPVWLMSAPGHLQIGRRRVREYVENARSTCTRLVPEAQEWKKRRGREEWKKEEKTRTASSRRAPKRRRRRRRITQPPQPPPLPSRRTHQLRETWRDSSASCGAREPGPDSRGLTSFLTVPTTSRPCTYVHIYEQRHTYVCSGTRFVCRRAWHVVERSLWPAVIVLYATCRKWYYSGKRIVIITGTRSVADLETNGIWSESLQSTSFSKPVYVFIEFESFDFIRNICMFIPNRMYIIQPILFRNSSLFFCHESLSSYINFT